MRFTTATRRAILGTAAAAFGVAIIGLGASASADTEARRNEHSGPPSASQPFVLAHKITPPANSADRLDRLDGTTAGMSTNSHTWS